MFVRNFSFNLLLFWTLWVSPTVVMAETNNINHFYGNNSLNSLVDDEKMMLTLPGRTRIEVTGQKTTYTLPDHLQSDRVAVIKDNTVSYTVDHNPFGDNQSNEINQNKTLLAKSYTGMTFEPELATYDYHARRYDPGSARFTSVDAIRQSISPYSYTENNPINFVDPNGFGRVSLLITIQDHEGNNQRDIMNHYNTFTILEPENAEISPETTKSVFFDKLEHSDNYRLFDVDAVTHLIIDTRIDGRAVALQDLPSKLNAYGGKIKYEHFAEYLKQTKMRGGGKNLKSIFLSSCQAASCLDGDGPSFAESFFSEAKALFPNLKEVVATPYNLDISIPARMTQGASQLLEFPPEKPVVGMLFTPPEFTEKRKAPEKFMRYNITSEQYLFGDFPEYMFREPNSTDGVEGNHYNDSYRPTPDFNKMITRKNVDQHIADLTIRSPFSKPPLTKFSVEP